MFEALIKLSEITLPVYVFLLMYNVGLTQSMRAMAGYLKDRGFGLHMLLANFVMAPLLMWGLLEVHPVDPYLDVGLTIFSFCAGSPFLIKLTQSSGNDLALGASTMLALVFATVILAPLALPRLIPSVEVNGWSIAGALIKQLILPAVLGRITVKRLPQFTLAIRPWVGRSANWALYVLLFSILVGYIPELGKIAGEGGMIIALVFVVGSFAAGYLFGSLKNQRLREIGGLATGQRNTAAALIVAAGNFSGHPSVIVVIILANTLGVIFLLLIARFFARKSSMRFLHPVGNRPD